MADSPAVHIWESRQPRCPSIKADYFQVENLVAARWYRPAGQGFGMLRTSL